MAIWFKQTTYEKGQRLTVTFKSRRDERTSTAVLKRTIFAEIPSAIAYLGDRYLEWKIDGRKIEPGQEWECDVVHYSKGGRMPIVILKPVRFVRQVHERKIIPFVKVEMPTEERFAAMIKDERASDPMGPGYHGEDDQTLKVYTQKVFEKLLVKAWPGAQVYWLPGGPFKPTNSITLPCSWWGRKRTRNNWLLLQRRVEKYD